MYSPETMCSKCGAAPRRAANQCWCKSCHNTYNRYFKRPLTAEGRWKMNARSCLHVYMRRGLVTKLPCELCGQPSEAHHEDYSKPLKVRWLCRSHHQMVTNGDLWLLPANQ